MQWLTICIRSDVSAQEICGPQILPEFKPSYEYLFFSWCERIEPYPYTRRQKGNTHINTSTLVERKYV